jgi:hypothetical protein
LGVCITVTPGTSIATLNYTASISGRCLDESTLLFWSRSQYGGQLALQNKHYTNDTGVDFLIEHLQFSVQIAPALIAQLVERVTSNDEVAGSTPS